MATLIDRHRRQNEIVEKFLKHYDDELESITERIKDIEDAQPSALGGDQCRNGSGISDPTFKKAAALSDPDIDRKLKWLALIREVEVGLPEQYLVVIKIWREFRFMRGPHGWAAKAERKFAAEMAKIQVRDEEETFRCKKTLEGYWSEIIEIAARMAVKDGLI